MGSLPDELMEKLEEAGLPPELRDRLEGLYASSPIRKEREEWKARAEAATAQAEKFRMAVMGQTFKEAGITINPQALNLPPDLDFENVEAVREWGSTMGLVSTQTTPPLTPPSEQRGAESFHAPGAGAGEPDLEATKIREMADLRNKRYAHGMAPNLQDVLNAASAAGWEDTRGR